MVNLKNLEMPYSNTVATKVKILKKAFIFLTSLRGDLRYQISIEKDLKKQETFLEYLKHIESDVERINCLEFLNQESILEELEDILLFYYNLKNLK